MHTLYCDGDDEYNFRFTDITAMSSYECEQLSLRFGRPTLWTLLI